MIDKETNSADSHCTGVVKWFNNRAGYGFVTATNGEKEGTDIFVHHSSIVVGKEQYKYLVQGEYVEFKIIPRRELTEEEQDQSKEVEEPNKGNRRGGGGPREGQDMGSTNRRPRNNRNRNRNNNKEQESSA